MKITIENTTKIVQLSLDGANFPARIWEGKTETGIPVHCYITRVAVAKEQDQSLFLKELQEKREEVGPGRYRQDCKTPSHPGRRNARGNTKSGVGKLRTGPRPDVTGLVLKEKKRK